MVELTTHSRAPSAEDFKEGDCAHHQVGPPHLHFGLGFLRWHEEMKSTFEWGSSKDSSKVNRKWDEYCKYKWAYKGVVPKHIKMWVSRCVALATPIASGKQVLEVPVGEATQVRASTP